MGSFSHFFLCFLWRTYLHKLILLVFLLDLMIFADLVLLLLVFPISIIPAYTVRFFSLSSTDPSTLMVCQLSGSTALSGMPVVILPKISGRRISPFCLWFVFLSPGLPLLSSRQARM